MEKKVLFDPGYAPVVMESLGQVGYIYYTFSAIPNIKLKRLNFPSTYKKLEKHLKTNIAFYLGCLMWASYISSFKDCEIEGNKLYGEICEEKEYTDEINFLIDFTKNQIPRDIKYFLNQNAKPNEKYLTILETYKDFLIINKGFCKTNNTSEIKLPENLKKLNDEELKNLNEIIQKAIQLKDIDSLLDHFEILF